MKRSISKNEFQKIISLHMIWLHDHTKGHQACFENIIFDSITFNNFNFSYGQFNNCKFVDCKFYNVKFKHSHIYNCKFEKVNITKAEMSNCDIFNTCFSQTVISNAVLTESVFRAGYMKKTHFLNIIALKMSIINVTLDFESQCSIENNRRNSLCFNIDGYQINLIQGFLNNDD